MNKIEIYTLIIGSSLISFLIILYYYQKYKKNRIIKFIVKGDKSIKRMHYILKHDKYKIIDINKDFVFKILYGDKYLQNKFSIVAVGKKENKKYLCFINDKIVSDSNINYDVLFKCSITRFYKCLIIDTNRFSLQPLQIYY